MITEPKTIRPLETYDVRYDIRTLEYGDPIDIKFKAGSQITRRYGTFKHTGIHNLVMESMKNGYTYKIPIVSIVSIRVMEPEEWLKKDHR